MEYPNGTRPVSRLQAHINAAHQARSAEMHRLAGSVGRGVVQGLRLAFSPLVRLARLLDRARQIRAARRELEEMDNHMLADLGISRDDIVDVVRNGKPAPDLPAQAPAHPHEAKRAAEVVELRRERDLMGALIVHGPWAHYSDRTKRNDAA